MLAIGVSIVPLMTLNNHFQFGYNGQPFNFRERTEDRFWVKYGRCERQPLSFHQECLEAARRIAENTKEPIWVLFSGGVDSEVTLQSFVQAKIPVQVAILRFKNDLNIHDISYAVIACHQLNVPYRIFDLDLLSFWQNEAFTYAKRVGCSRPRLLSTMWLMDQIEGYPVIGGGECHLIKELPSDYVSGGSPYPTTDWHMSEKEYVASWYRHLILTQRDGCAGFFQYTPEIILSYLLEDDIVDLTSNRKEGKLSTKSSKLPIYQKYFSVQSRPKFTGFERAAEPEKVIRQRLLEICPEGEGVVKTPYKDLVNLLSPSVNKGEAIEFGAGV